MQFYLRQFCTLLWLASTLLSQANMRFHEHFCQEERVAQQWIHIGKTLDCSGVSDSMLTEKCSNSNNHAISNKCCSDRIHSISLEECSLDQSITLIKIGEDREYQTACLAPIQLHCSPVHAPYSALCIYGCDPPPILANRTLLKAIARWNI